MTLNRRAFVAGTLAAPFALPAASSAGRAAISDGLAAADPSALGFDADALRAATARVRDGATNIHSLLVMRDGKLAAELYRAGPDRSLYSLWASRHAFGPADLHDMRSVTKSVVSLLYGILHARGEEPDLDVPVASLYPDCPELDDPARRAIRIRHLLTMSAGLDWMEPSPVRRASSTDEIGLAFRACAYRYVFGRDIVAPPGTAFTYSGGLTAVLGETLARSAKRPLRDIARDELFAPLGIADWEWIGDLHGQPIAPAGLRLAPRDLMKIGAMMLAGGRWQGRQVVPAEWVAESTKTGIATPPLGGYGYQWWTMTAQRKGRPVDVVAAIGNGGQRLFLAPDLDLAVVTTAGDYNDPAIIAPLKAVLDEVVRSVAA